MAENSTKLTFTAEDRTAAAFRSIESSMRGLEQNFGRLSGLMAGFAGGALVAAFGAAIRASEDAAQAQRKLDAVLRATGNTTGYTSEQLGKLADNLARTSKFDDEGFKEATATLVRFGNIGGENLEKVLKLSADYAALTGGDLASAAEKMGRALSNPAEGLKKLERNFGDLGKEVEDAIELQTKMGNSSRALELAIEALQKKIGGADAAMNQGLTGSINNLKKAFGDLLEAVGSGADNGFFTSVLDGATARLRGLKAILEEGSWVDTLMRLGAILNGNGPGAMLAAIGNAAPARVTPGAPGGAGGFSLADQDTRALAALDATMKKREELWKKSADEIAAYNEKMRQTHLRGEEEALKAEHAALEEFMRQEYLLRKEGMDNAQDIREMELEGQIWLSQNVVKIVEEENRQVEALRQANFTQFWEEASDLAGNFFSDLVMNGKSAFDNLRQVIKSVLADMIALFAKRWVLNLAAGGSMLGSAGSALAGSGGAGGFGGLGSLTAFGPVGTALAAGALVYALYQAFNDGPENTNFRWRQGTGGPGLFGGVSSEGNYGFDASGVNSIIGGYDQRLARILGPGGVAAATQGLSAYTQTGLRMDGQPAQFGIPEGADAAAVEQITKEILQSRYSIIFEQIDAGIAETIRTWEGSATDLQAYIETAIGIVEGLAQLNITGLNISTLQQMQLAGETLAQTFQRVGSAWSWFQENFTTDAERLTRAQTDVTDTFAALGIEIPASLTDFRLLVEGIDLSTESGRALWTELMRVAPAFLTVTNAADQLTDSTEDLTEALSDAVVMTVELQQRIQEEVRRSREQRLDQIVGARGGLQGFLQQTMLDPGLTTLTPQERLEEARRQYESVLNLARSGDLGASGRLGGVAENYLRIAREMFASSSSYVDIFSRVTSDVQGVDARLAMEEQMLRATLGISEAANAQVELLIDVKSLLIQIRDKPAAATAGTFEPR